MFMFFVLLLLSMTLISSVLASEEPDYGLVFKNDNILSFYMTIGREDWLGMRNRPFQYVKGTVRFANEIYEDVGIRYKGNSSSSVRGLKKPYKFKFDKYKKQRFHGFKKLNFSNGFKDPSLLREKLAYDLFQKAGVPASQTTFAKLYLTVPGEYDDEYIGLYTIVEQVDKVFLKDRFGDTEGALFKVDGMLDLDYRGENPKRYERNYIPKLSKKQQNYSALISFIKMLKNTPDEEFPARIEEAFNVESFLSWLAVNTLLSNLDSYAGSGHNFYIYFRSDTGICEFIPWDLNEAFGNFQMGAKGEDMLNLSIYEPYAEPKILIERIINVPKFRKKYIEKIKSLMDGEFGQEAMFAKMDTLFGRIAADVRSDQWKPFDTRDFDRSLDHHIQPSHHPQVSLILALKPFVIERCISVDKQLAGEGKGFVPRARRPRFDRDFPPFEMFTNLQHELRKASELVDTDARQTRDIAERVAGALEDLGKRIGPEKGEVLDSASKRLNGIREEIERTFSENNKLSSHRADEYKKIFGQISQIIHKFMPPLHDELSRKLDELHRLMDKCREQEIDVSEARKLDEKSKEYVERGDIKSAVEIISRAIDILKNK